MSISTVALIGFGEVGHVLASDLKSVSLRVFDIKPERSQYASASEAAIGADLIVSAVTAAQTLIAAESVVAGLTPGVWFVDLNSASPEAKSNSARVIDQAGGRYVEVAVMSPINPKRLASPMLLGGPHARAAEPVLQTLGFTGARFYSETPGQAAATKLCRSVMIKGLEALVSESLLSARHYGVEREVMDSLANLIPDPDWPAYARYLISRTLEHGTRRAEEMREAAKTVAEAGVDPWMCEGIVRRQDWGAAHRDSLSQTDLSALLDDIRSKRNP